MESRKKIYFQIYLLFNLERNGRSNEQSETKQQTNGSDSPLISTNRQQEPGVIRYVYDGIESTIQYSSPNLSNTSALYCGDKVNIDRSLLKMILF